MNQKTLQNCGKCGLCLNACPVYKILKEEQASPRARLQLIKAFEEDRLLSSPLLKEIISKCLMCGSCTGACPSGIDHYSQFMEMRQKMAKDHVENPMVKSMIWLLSQEYRTRLGAKMAKLGQKLVPERFKEKYGLGNIPLKRLPEFNITPFREAAEETISHGSKPAGTIVYFTGCATNYLYDDTGFSTLRILEHMGYRVIIPKKQTCCGIPLLFHGAQKAAKNNIVTNINALDLDAADTILVDCATCGTALKHEYPLFTETLGLDKTKVEKIASKVEDIMSFIQKRFHLLSFTKDSIEKVKATYHIPCHLKNSFGSHEQAQTLLNRLPCIVYSPADNADQCCGGGGSFFYEYPEISKQMVTKKIEGVKATLADIWLTDCPVCRMNLAGNMEEKNELQVVHPVKVIAPFLN
ncbi:MAG: (Fe-S)-binding protein [Desulfobacteraceae bacterium]|nr:(Fe-S)-binding protein [Desulfobacteraceae bacterium]